MKIPNQLQIHKFMSSENHFTLHNVDTSRKQRGLNCEEFSFVFETDLWQINQITNEYPLQLA